MSNPFEIAANATSHFASIPTVPAVPPIRPGPKLKPLVERKNLHALQLAQHKSSLISVTAEGLFTQFKTSEMMNQTLILQLASINVDDHIVQNKSLQLLAL